MHRSGYFPVTDDQRRAHDTHSHPLALAVVLSLALLAYLGTLAGPEFWVVREVSSLLENRHRLVILSLTAAAFLGFYYLPLPAKRLPAVLAALVGVAVVFGPLALLALASLMLVTYAAFHRQPNPHLKTVAAHAAPLACLLVLATGLEAFPYALLTAFWLWPRLVLYRADLADGKVPPTLPFREFLATFLSPAYLANVYWVPEIGKGYAYHSNAFLARPKNQIVLSGLKILTLGALFFALRPLVLEAVHELFSSLGPAYRTYPELITRLERGYQFAPATVWSALVYQFLDFYLLWSAVTHCKVGLWRLLGYDLEGHFQKPFLATNLVELWGRYSFYYKEFLVQIFYYPAFLKLFKGRPTLRILTATMGAACVGNFLYHLVFGLLEAPTRQEVIYQLRTLPYYVLFGLAIAVTNLVILRWGRHRRPWTGPPALVALDVLAVLATFAAEILIRTFHFMPRYHDLAWVWRVVLAAFGLA